MFGNLFFLFLERKNYLKFGPRKHFEHYTTFYLNSPFKFSQKLQNFVKKFAKLERRIFSQKFSFAGNPNYTYI